MPRHPWAYLKVGKKILLNVVKTTGNLFLCTITLTTLCLKISHPCLDIHDTHELILTIFDRNVTDKVRRREKMKHLLIAFFLSDISVKNNRFMCVKFIAS